ncbi:MAG: hypothetical protein ACJ73E_14605 [Mycobacteriales bacterium]
METRRRSGWASDQAIVAIIGGLALVLAAVVTGVLANRDGGAEQQHGEPSIIIRATTFGLLPGGKVLIRVTGEVTDFPPADRVYAIAQPMDVKSWWVSDQVAPTLAGTWEASIEASPKQGQQLRVSAVRVSGDVLSPPPQATDTGSGTGTPSPRPSAPTRADIESDLRSNGPAGRFADGAAESVTGLVPPSLFRRARP